MDNLNHWRVCDEVTVFQAIMLCLGIDPKNQSSYDIENALNAPPIPPEYGAYKTALSAALRKGDIQGNNVEITHYIDDEIPAGQLEDSTDINESTVNLNSVREFLESKGISEGFFFPPSEPVASNYLDPANSAYAPKLAAAVEAWLAVTNDATALRGKSPKRALKKWLHDNASRYGLIKDDGKPNETGIKEVSKVANWKPEGGANKTPTQASGTHPPTKKRKK